jgi:hypothetical protein
VEPVWSLLKRSLAGLVKRNLRELTALIKTRLRRRQYQAGLIGGSDVWTGILINVDIYLAVNEVAVHNHRSPRAGRISSHVSPSR